MKKETGIVIRAFRKYQNYTQYFVANKLNVTVETIANIENGRVSIDIERLYKLSFIFGVQIRDLMALIAEIFEKGSDIGVTTAVKYLSPSNPLPRF